MNENYENESLEFDAEIEDGEAPEQLILEGKFPFVVDDIIRGQFPGSKKLGPCNKVTVCMIVKIPGGTNQRVWTDLLLCKSMEWKLSNFFRCIGLKKPGERFRMDFRATLGKEGIADFAPRTYVGKDGMEHTVNDIKKFLNPPEWLRDAENTAEEELPF